MTYPVRRRKRFTDADMWEIIATPASVSDRAIATALDATETAVHSARWRLQHDGWVCPLDFTPCSECHKPLIRRHGRQLNHADCRPAVLYRLNASYEPHRPADQIEARNERRDAFYAASQHETREHATHHGLPYGNDDVVLLLELADQGVPAPAIALLLGRSLASVNTKRARLRGTRKK